MLIMLRNSVLLFAFAVLASGCTRSIAAEYQPGLALDQPVAHAGVQLGVARFVDTRPWIEKDNAKSQSFIAQQGPWRFGLGYGDAEYIPVNDFVQRVMVSEFKTAGYSASAVGDHPMTDAKELLALCDSAGVDYALGGTIMTFEFVNTEHAFTVDSRRTVSMALTLVHRGAAASFENSLYNENDKQGEGMGVLHSTNVNKLVNGPFKKVMVKVIKDMSLKMAVRADDIKVAVSYEGETSRFAVASDFTLVAVR